MRESTSTRASTPGPLAEAYDPGPFFDEMFESAGKPRPHSEVLLEQLSRLSFEEFEERRHAVDVSFVNQGSASRFTARTRESSGSSPST